jgi:uncharacterized membrane protein YtjA (UPF0391 family)
MELIAAMECSSHVNGLDEVIAFVRTIIKVHPMLNWAILFLVLAVAAAVTGFGGLAGTFAGLAQILFFVFLVLLVISLVFGATRGRLPRL